LMSDLERRDLLKAAALVGGGLAGVTAGCIRNPELKAPREAYSWLESLDSKAAQKVVDSFGHRLAWINEQTLPEEIISSSMLQKLSPLQVASSGDLVKKSIRSLYAVGRFMDLSDELKAHPKIQEQMASLQPEIDDAALGMLGMLEQMTPNDHKVLRDHLRDDPEFGERIAMMIDETAKEDGLPFQRRFGVRSSILQLASRMGAQSPALVTDALVSKGRRLEALSSEEHHHLYESKFGKEKLAAYEQKLVAIHGAWMQQSQPVMSAASQPSSQPSSQPVAQQPPPPKPDPMPMLPPQQAPVRGVKLLRAGGYMMGLGAVSTGIGAILLSVSAAEVPIIGLVLGITLGPILLAVGLIVLLIGLIVKASAA
jgi:hypothetical protein